MISEWTTDRFVPLSPLDGRYRASVQPLAPWLSEEGLNRMRLHIEAEWFVFALDSGLFPGVAPLTEEESEYVRSLPREYTGDQRERLAQLEAETRHDVKAVEYLLREHLQAAPGSRLAELQELAHFLCTSEDINNLSYALCVKTAMEQVWIPAAKRLVGQLSQMAHDYAGVPMLARTHGQPATPTTVGKELAVFASRMGQQLDRIQNAEYRGKFNGATGTYSAHVAVLPTIDWQQTSSDFVSSLGLTWNPVTTQIEPHDWQGNLFGDVIHFNRIAHNLATDCWMYISLGYFKQNLQGEGNTGSSTMPHKVNPIRFENAEANLEMSDGVLEVLSRTLATSRMQRDLSDSSMQRNIGIGLGYSLVALDNLLTGLSKLDVDQELVARDLEDHPEVLSEAIQQALRVAALVATASSADAGTDDSATTAKEPYKMLKDLTRGRQVQLEDLRLVVRESNLPSDLRDRLLSMKPSDYIGIAEDLADRV